MWGYGLDQAGSGQGQVAGTFECGNEPSGSVKCGEFLDQLRTASLNKKDSAVWSKYVSKFIKPRQPNTGDINSSVNSFCILLSTTRKIIKHPAECPIVVKRPPVTVFSTAVKTLQAKRTEGNGTRQSCVKGWKNVCKMCDKLDSQQQSRYWQGTGEAKTTVCHFGSRFAENARNTIAVSPVFFLPSHK